jgi:hypothetical protein
VTIRKLASAIAKIEGKKSQARIGDIREILAILGDLWFAEVEEHKWSIDKEADAIDSALYRSGASRAKRKGKR